MTEAPPPTLPQRLAAWIREEGLLDRGGPDPGSVQGPETAWGPELDVLLRSGSVRESDLEEGLWTLLEAATLEGAAVEGERGMAAAGRIRQQLRQWDRYRGLTLIGLGGGGAVFEAYDPRLDRKVALKFLWSQSPDTLARLVREAKAQAQIEHPHVVKVYEVDTALGLWYLSMQLVRGRNLLQLAPGLPLAQRIALLVQAAQAAHAAHRMGMVHLDLKPGNVLVERTGQGVLWAYLADFGLAHGRSATDAAVVPLGTPPFSSPEQMRGEAAAIDRRSDVYSLGICLYHLASGQLPYDNLDPRVFQGPRPVPAISLRRRRPELSLDLVAIVEKAMAWNAADRYESAQAFAADLERFLNGEPVQARGGGWKYRLRLQIRKQRLAASVAGLSAVGLLALGGVVVVTRLRVGRQIERAQLFGRRVEQIDSMLWREYALPLHDVRSARERAHQQLADMERELAAFGPEASGPGHAFLGRGLIDLGEIPGARFHLQKAWDGGHRTPECSYLLGLALGHLYKSKLDEAHRIQDAAVRSARLAEAEREYRDPALARLRSGAASAQDPPEYLQGLIAFFERRYDQALALAAQARRTSPGFHPAWLLAGDAAFSLAQDLSQQGDFAGFDRWAGEAEAAHRQAIQIVRSNPEALARWGIVATRIVEIKAYQRGQWDEERYRAARTACREALVANPQDPWLFGRIAWMALAGARHHTDRSLDPSRFFHDASASLEEALRVDPKHVQSWLIHARIAYQRALWSTACGRDPRPELALSIQFAERAVALAPGDRQAHADLGLAHMELAFHALGDGRDPVPEARSALASFHRSAELAPDDAGSYTHIVAADNMVARARLERNEDPWEALEDAGRALAAALRIAPGSYWVHRNAVGLEYLRAWADHRAGKDIAAALERAQRHEQAAMAAIPEGEEVLWYTMIYGRVFVAAISPAGSPLRREALVEARKAMTALARLRPKPGLLRSLRRRIEALDYSRS